MRKTGNTESKKRIIFPVWYLGAIDTKMEQDDDVCKITNWGELQDLLEEL